MVTVVDPGFPRLGAPTPGFGAKAYYLTKYLPKSAWKWKNLGRPWIRHELFKCLTTYPFHIFDKCKLTPIHKFFCSEDTNLRVYMFVSLHIRSMWETICDAQAGFCTYSKFLSKFARAPPSGISDQSTPPPHQLKFRQILAIWVFSVVTPEYPPPPPRPRIWEIVCGD